jgi:hypothetical protein
VLGSRHLRIDKTTLTRTRLLHVHAAAATGFHLRPDLPQQPWSAYVSAEDALVTGQDSCTTGHADLIRLCRCRFPPARAPLPPRPQSISCCSKPKDSRSSRHTEHRQPASQLSCCDKGNAVAKPGRTPGSSLPYRLVLYLSLKDQP